MSKSVALQAQDAKVLALMDSLPQHQQDAIVLIKLALDCYNSFDGTGLFKGMERYKVLQERLKISAIQSQSLFDFWSNLLKRMMWALPPKAADSLIVNALSDKDDRKVLTSIANDTPSLISIARLLHDNDKQTKKALWVEEQAEQKAIDDALTDLQPHNDQLEF